MIKSWHKMRDTLNRWATQPVTELSRKQRAARYWFELICHCMAELRYDKAGQMAAALTYHTLFSLMPTLVLMLVVSQVFIQPEHQEQFKQTAVNWLLRPITPEVVAATTPDNTPTTEVPSTLEAFDEEVARLADERQREFHDARAAIDEQIQSLLDALSNVSFRGIGILGLLIFIYGATGLLTSIEKSFNHIYNAPRMRPVYLRFPLYFTVIVLGPLVVLAGQFAQQWFITTLQAGSWTN